MLEKATMRLAPICRAHPWLRWPILALLLAICGAEGLWSAALRFAGELRAVGREVRSHLRETGVLLALGAATLGRWVKTTARPQLARHCHGAICALRRCGLAALSWARADLPALAAGAASRCAALGKWARTKAVAAGPMLTRECAAARRGAPRRAMAMALCLCMVLTLLPVSALAAESEESGCTHTHDVAVCGYVEAVEPHDCTYTHTHDAECGFTPAVEEVPCDKACTDADGDGAIDHADCAYTPAVVGTDCTHTHTHDAVICGYVEAVAGQDCTHVCDENCGGLPAEEEAPVTLEEPDGYTALTTTEDVHTHDSVTFDKPLLAAGAATGPEELTAGSYVLSKDIEGNLLIPAGVTVNLCLNGHQIKATEGAVIEVQGTLNLYDCNGSKGRHTITVDGTDHTITGGLITGGTGMTWSDASATRGGGIYLMGECALNMYGGTIAGNSATDGGGGIFAEQNKNGNPAVTLHSGTISYNTVGSSSISGDGGGCYTSGIFTMNGGSISNNTASGKGGGLVAGGLESDVPNTYLLSTVTLNGGSITGNTTGGNGGGVRVVAASADSYATITLSGTTISGNSATGAGPQIHASGKVKLDADCGNQSIFLVKTPGVPMEVNADLAEGTAIALDANQAAAGASLVSGVTSDAQKAMFTVSNLADQVEAYLDGTIIKTRATTATEKTAAPELFGGFNLGTQSYGNSSLFTFALAKKYTDNANVTYTLYSAATGTDKPAGLTVAPYYSGEFSVSGVTTLTECFVTAQEADKLESDRVAVRLLPPYIPDDEAVADEGKLTITTPAQLCNYLNFCSPGAATLTGSTVKLTKDIMIAHDITITGSFDGVLDLGGKSISHASDSSGTALLQIKDENVKLTVKNGTLRSVNQATIQQIGGTVTAEDLTLDNLNGGCVELQTGSFSMTNTTIKLTDVGQFAGNSQKAAYTMALMVLPGMNVALHSGTIANPFTGGMTYQSYAYNGTDPGKKLSTCIPEGSTAVPAESTTVNGKYVTEVCREKITITNGPQAFVAVTGITGVPTAATKGTDLTLTGTVAPANATNKTIVWSVKNAGTTGATIADGKLSTAAAGTVTVTATIVNGKTASTNYTQDFTITVTSPFDGILSAPLSQDEVNSAFGAGKATFVAPNKVVINENLVLTDTIKIQADVTIDLNGKAITGAAGTDETSGIGKDALQVDKGKKLIITDKVGGGAITGGAGLNSASGFGGYGGTGIFISNGSVVVNGGAINGGAGGSPATIVGGTGGNGIVGNFTAEVEINGGTVTGGKGGDCPTGSGGTGATGVSSYGNVTVNQGGKVTGGDGGSGATGGNGGNGVSTYNNGTITVNRGGIVTGGIGGTGSTGAGGDGGNGANSGRGAITVNQGGTVTGGIGGSATGPDDTSIGGDGGHGVSSDSGAIINNGVTTGGAGGPSIKGEGGAGGSGATSSDGNITIGAGGTTTGGNGALSIAGDGGAGGAGASTTGSGTITVDKGGNAIGGIGGAGMGPDYNSNGGAGGNGVSSDSGAIINNGVTTGGAGGSSIEGEGGEGGAGVSSVSGAITNNSDATGGAGGGSTNDRSGTGGNGISSSDGNITIGNGSTSTGGKGGEGMSGGAGGAGASTTGTGAITVNKGGSAIGGAGGAGTANDSWGSGGHGGSGVVTGGVGANTGKGNIINNGTVTGGHGGSSIGAQGGMGGYGAASGTGTITIGSGGTATGGAGGSGVTGGAGGSGAYTTDYTKSGDITIEQGGSAMGGAGGAGTTGNGGNGGKGAHAGRGATLTNNGNATGGNGGSSASGNGGNGETGADGGVGGIVINNSVATGGAGGSSTNGAGGAGGNGADTVNTGSTITTGPGSITTGGAGGSGITGGKGGCGTDTTGAGGGGTTTIHGTVTGGAGGNATSATGGVGGIGANTQDGNITITTGGSVKGGQGGASSAGKGGNGGTGSSAAGNGNVDVAAGGSSTGGTGGAGGGTNAGGNGGAGTGTGSSGNTTVNGSVTGGNGGSGTSSGGNGGNGGSGACENGTITGTGTITGGNGGNIPEGGTGTPGTGGSAITGGGNAADPGGPTTKDGQKGVNANAKVDNTQNSSGAAIAVPEADLVNAAIEDAERTDDTITKIDVTLTIVNKTTEKPDAGAVNTALASTGASQVGVYLDIKLEKAITKADGTTKIPVTEAKAPLTITITLPVAMQGGSNYTVIRVHNNVATVLPTRYNAVNHTLEAETDQFSTYAIAYTPAATDPTPPPYDGGSSSSGSSTTPPTVTKPDGGAVKLSPANPRPGQAVTLTAKPDEGKRVESVVVTDKDGKEVPVTKQADGTYAFTYPKGGATVTVTFENIPAVGDFADVKPGDWYYEGAKFVLERGLMNGTGSDTFSPGLDATRGMVVAILWRLAGEPAANAAASFTDVSAGAYYAKAVAWGTENGIVKGYDSHSFGPDDAITREQLAAMLHRYAQLKGMDVKGTADLAAFTDQPSAWAAEAMEWAVGAGVITGKGGGILAPTGPATRAEVAAVLQRYCALSD